VPVCPSTVAASDCNSVYEAVASMRRTLTPSVYCVHCGGGHAAGAPEIASGLAAPLSPPIARARVQSGRGVRAPSARSCLSASTWLSARSAWPATHSAAHTINSGAAGVRAMCGLVKRLQFLPHAPSFNRRQLGACLARLWRHATVAVCCAPFLVHRQAPPVLAAQRCAPPPWLSHASADLLVPWLSSAPVAPGGVSEAVRC
jgi:hypothetical protein